VFCRSVAGILGGTTQTQPVRKAGGDGTFGRRDFTWQGGREISLGYQKRNVFGFGLDFAEDVTKTSWGVEFSWVARKLIPTRSPTATCRSPTSSCCRSRSTARRSSTS
jgi:hypothetical protein